MRQPTTDSLVIVFRFLVGMGATMLVLGLGQQLPLLSFVPELIARVFVPFGTSLVTAGLIGLLNVGGIREEISRLDPYLRAFEKMKPFVVTQIHAIQNVYAKRDDAISEIARYLSQEEERIEITASSLKGLIGVLDPGYYISPKQVLICDVLKNIRQRGCNCRILLTHPSLAFLRARQERRQPGAIEEEILKNLRRLVEEFGVPLQQIRLYKGTPTAFCVITTERMWLNPYPYEETSMDSFCLELGPGPIYDFYRRQHFLEAWAGPNAVRFDSGQTVDQVILSLQQLMTKSVQDQFQILDLLY